VSQGAVQNFHSNRVVTTVQGQHQTIPGGPIASQESIKEAGQNGGGPYNANSGHPFENPNPITNLLELWLILALPFAFPWMFGKMAGNLRQGLVVLSVMIVFWLVGALVAMHFDTNPSPKLTALRVNQSVTATQAGGNGEGTEARFGPV